MLLQTNSYLVPESKRAEHERLMRRFRACFERLGSEFEVFEQTDDTFAPAARGTPAARFVQMMHFRDVEHQRQVQDAEQHDDVAKRLIADFVRLVDLPRQQQQGLYAAGHYRDLPADDPTPRLGPPATTPPPEPDSPHPTDAEV